MIIKIYKFLLYLGDQTETEIPLPNVRGSILKKVIKYMQYHHTNPAKEIEKPLKSANMREVCPIYVVINRHLRIFAIYLYFHI